MMQYGLTAEGLRRLRDAANPDKPHSYEWYVIENINTPEKRMDHVSSLETAIRTYAALDCADKRLGVTKDGIAAVDIIIRHGGREWVSEDRLKLDSFKSDPTVAAAVMEIQSALEDRTPTQDTATDRKEDDYNGQEIPQSDLDMLFDAPQAPTVLPETIDLQTLRFLYGIILNKFFQNIGDIVQRINDDAKQFLSYNVTIYIPDYVESLGMSRNINQRVVERVVSKIYGYSSLWGIVETNSPGRSAKGYYPVMIPLGYEEADNTLTFSSPYINRIITLIIQGSIRRDKGGGMVRKKTGEFVTGPSHSYHVKPSIIKNSSEWAKDIVDVVCVLLDKAGDTRPHIRYSTIVERCYGFTEYLEAQPTKYKRNRVLQRSFSTAWKLLAADTDLLEKFRDLKLPAPNDPQAIPTMQTLDEVRAAPPTPHRHRDTPP